MNPIKYVKEYLRNFGTHCTTFAQQFRFWLFRLRYRLLLVVGSQLTIDPRIAIGLRLVENYSGVTLIIDSQY